ncbi:MAG: GIY-YIG nuclease family protein [Desulfobacterales bacterium]
MEKKYQVYIIQSQSNGSYYCGYSGNVKQRLASHNDPAYRLTRTTKFVSGPWQIVWTSEFLSRSEAVKLERKVKKRGIGRFLHETESAESRRRRD